MTKQTIILFASHVVAAIALLLLTIFLTKDAHHFNLMILAFFIFSVLALLTCVLENNKKGLTRISFCVIGITSMILGLILIFAKDKVGIQAACILMGILEILNCGIKIEESVHRIKKKDIFGALLIPAIIGEIVLGILLCIEAEPNIQLHLILISVVITYEGITDFIFELVEHRREQRKEVKE